MHPQDGEEERHRVGAGGGMSCLKIAGRILFGLQQIGTHIPDLEIRAARRW